MAKYKVTVVGCGGMSRGWIKNLMDRRDVEVVGLVDLNIKNAKDRAEQFELGDGVVYKSLKEAVKGSASNVVVDLTVPAAHPAICIEAMKLGCHVLSEKPMAETLKDAKRMVATAKKTGVTYAVMQNRRYLPTTRTVQKFIADGKLGRLDEMHCDFFLGPHFGGFRDVMDDVLLVDMAIHTFDAARCMGGVDPVAVYCYGFNPSRSWYKGNANAVAIFEMSNGVVYTYRGSWCARGMSTEWEASWRFLGEKGTLINDSEGIRVETLKATKRKGKFEEFSEKNITPPKLAKPGHIGCIDAFFTALAKGQKPETDCEDNIKSVAMVDAAVKSSHTGKRVKIEL